MGDRPHEDVTPSLIGRERIVHDLRTSMGLAAGDIVEVHSSLRSIGFVNGGAETVITSLADAVDAPSSGTLAMPCFASPRKEVDLRTQPTIIGAIPERFRRWPLAVRSFHPTHSTVALGRLAEWATGGHPSASALGVDSPFHRLANEGSKVLMIGCSFTSCSLVHVAETLAALPFLDIPYPGYEISIETTHIDGKKMKFDPVEIPGDSSGFGQVEALLEERGELVRGEIGNAPSLLADGRAILDAALFLLHRNPATFLVNVDRSEVNRRRLERFQQWSAIR